MPQVNFSNFFSTLPTTVSFPLKRRAKRPSALCWFNPNQLEGALPDFEEVIGEHWDITNEDFPVLTEEETLDELHDLLGDFCPPSSKDLFIDEELHVSINKKKAFAELYYGLQTESEGFTCADVIQESKFLDRVRSFYLLSKAVSACASVSFMAGVVAEKMLNKKRRVQARNPPFAWTGGCPF